MISLDLMKSSEVRIAGDQSSSVPLHRKKASKIKEEIFGFWLNFVIFKLDQRKTRYFHFLNTPYGNCCAENESTAAVAVNKVELFTTSISSWKCLFIIHTSLNSNLAKNVFPDLGI